MKNGQEGHFFFALGIHIEIEGFFFLSWHLAFPNVKVGSLDLSKPSKAFQFCVAADEVVPVL